MITEVRVPGAVIRSEMGFTEVEVSMIRAYFRGPEEVAAAVAMGDKLRGELLEAITLYGRRIDDLDVDPGMYFDWLATPFDRLIDELVERRSW